MKKRPPATEARKAKMRAYYHSNKHRRKRNVPYYEHPLLNKLVKAGLTTNEARKELGLPIKRFRSKNHPRAFVRQPVENV